MITSIYNRILNTGTLLIFLLAICSYSFAQKVNVKQQFNNAQQQVTYMLAVIDSLKKDTASAKLVSPRSTDKGKFKMVRGQDWTSGFFPGELWFLYEYTGKQKWMDEAKKYTALIEPQKFNSTTHDLGFMIYCSFGNAYRLTGDTGYRNVIIQAAKTLSKRFNRVAGVIRSWDFTMDKWQYPVIIDNMMNLELLFEATKLTGDSSFYRIAVTHANTTLKNHFRPNYSSYHVIDYDP